jgi:hypothetical protein
MHPHIDPLDQQLHDPCLLGREWVSAKAFDQAGFRAALPWMMPRTSDSFMIKRSSPSMRTSLPDHLPKRIRSPTLTPASERAPSPTEMTSPSAGFFLCGVGNDQTALFALDPANEDAVVKGRKLQGRSPIEVGVKRSSEAASRLGTRVQ